MLWAEEQVEMTASPSSAFDTKQACEREVSRVLDGLRKTRGVTIIHQRRSMQLKKADGSSLTTATRYVCFPDTVDPRGPKGK